MIDVSVQAQPSPFDFVSSMSVSERLNWSVDMLAALFQCKQVPIRVSTLPLYGAVGRPRGDSLDLDSSMESSAEEGADSSQELLPVSAHPSPFAFACSNSYDVKL